MSDIETYEVALIEIELLQSVNAAMLAALRPLAAAAAEFDWVDEKSLDREGVFLWSKSDSRGPGLKISVGDVFRARDAIAMAERRK